MTKPNEKDGSSALLDALGGLNDARDLLGLLAMGHRHNPDQDAQPVMAGLNLALSFLDKSTELLKTFPAYGKGV